MIKRHRLPRGGDRDTAERLFDALMVLDDLAQPSEQESVRRKLTIGELYAYASVPDEAADPALSRALLEDPEAAETFHRILEKTAPFHLPRTAAASSGDIERRVGRNCQIRFVASRAEPSQVFVMIELAEPEMPPPSRLYIYRADKQCASFPLPPALEGVIQMLEEENSDLLGYLRDFDTEVFLR